MNIRTELFAESIFVVSRIEKKFDSISGQKLALDHFGTTNVPLAFQLRVCFNTSVVKEIGAAIQLLSVHQSIENPFSPRYLGT